MSYGGIDTFIDFRTPRPPKQKDVRIFLSTKSTFYTSFKLSHEYGHTPLSQLRASTPGYYYIPTTHLSIKKHFGRIFLYKNLD